MNKLIWKIRKAYFYKLTLIYDFPGGSVVKNLTAVYKMWVQSLGREDPLEKETDNPFQYSCLENPMDGGAW